jgi:hypothetical protein
VRATLTSDRLLTQLAGASGRAVALARPFARNRGLRHVRRRNTDLLTPVEVADDTWAPLRKLVGQLSGTVEGDPIWCDTRVSARGWNGPLTACGSSLIRGRFLTG